VPGWLLAATRRKVQVLKLSLKILSAAGHAAGEQSEKFFLSRKEPLRCELRSVHVAPMNDYCTIDEAIEAEKLGEHRTSGRFYAGLGVNFDEGGGGTGRLEEFRGSIRVGKAETSPKVFAKNTILAFVESLQNAVNVTMGQQASRDGEVCLHNICFFIFFFSYLLISDYFLLIFI